MNEKQSNRQKLLSDHTTVYSLNEEWNAFLILYELKSFSQTAQKLNVTQSALSKTIKKLEDRLKITLFDRTQRPIRPTAEAVILHDEIFQHALEIENVIKKVKTQNYLKPVLRFGCTESTSRFMVPQIAQVFCNRIAKFIQVTASSEVLVEKLIKRELDVVFICEGFEEIPGLNRQFIFEEPSILLLPATLAQKKTKWTIQDLLCCGLPMIGYASGSGGGRLNDRLFSTFDVHFQSHYEIQSDSVLIEMIKLGLGWTITRPMTLLTGSHFEDKIKALPLDDKQNMLKYYVVSRKDEYVLESLEISKICKKIYIDIIQKEFLKFAPWIKMSD